jgi:hypothetical protein
MYNYDFHEDNKIIKDINKFLPNIEKDWVYTTCCQSCNSVFGSIINRQHHCRCCGRSFCWECCHNNIEIPIDILNVPKEQNTYKKDIKKMIGYFANYYENTKKVVCNNCHSKLLNLNKIKIFIHILGFCDIDTLHKTLLVSKKFYHSSIYWLFNFKNIQYKSLNYNKWDLNMLKSTAKYINQHNIWIKTLFKAYIYEMYIYNKSRFDVEKILHDAFNDKNINCDKMYCSLLCCQKMNIYDLIEIIENIINYEKTEKIMFWENLPLKINLRTLIDNISYSNNSTINNLFHTIMITLSKFVSTKKENVDLDMIFKLFDLILLDSRKIARIIYESDIFNLNNTFIEILELYVVHKKILLDDELIKFKKIRDFVTTLYHCNINNLNNIYYLNNINTKYLPIAYIFDFDVEIVEILEITNKNSDIYLRVKIRYTTNMREEIKKILIKKILNYNEYHYNNLIKYIYDRTYLYFIKKQILMPELNICINRIINKNYMLTEINDSDISMIEIKNKNMTINDYIYKNNICKTVEKMLYNYSFSLSFLCVICYLLNLNIKNTDNVFLDRNGKLYVIQYDFVNHKTNNIFVTKTLCSILGFKGGDYYTEYEKQVIEMLNSVKINEYFIESYIRLHEIQDLNKSHLIKNNKISRNDIKIINE